MSDDLRAKVIRLAHSLPKGSESRKALLEVLAENKTAAVAPDSWPHDHMMDQISRAADNVDAQVKNLKRIPSASKGYDDARKHSMRIVGILLREGLQTIVSRFDEQLADEMYALGTKIQSRKKL